MTTCIMGPHCSVFDAVLKIPGVVYFQPICEGCRTRTVGELRMLRLDYLDLTQALPKSDRRNDVTIFRPKPESSLPLNLQVFTLRHQIAHAVILAEASVRGVPRPGPVREAVAMSEALYYLENHVGPLASLTATEDYWDVDSGLTDVLDGPQVLLWFTALHRRARLILGLAPRTVGVSGYCPRCSSAQLCRHEDDESRYWCAACKLTMDRETYMQVKAVKTGP